MTKEEIIQKIDKLRDELIRLNGKDTSFAETIAYCQQRQEKIRQRRKQIHNEVGKLQVEISRMDL